MRKALCILAVCLLAGLLGGCWAEAVNAPAVELCAVNVGKGDALVLRVGEWTGLIDAGKARARGRVASALARLGVARLDAVFLTHTDDDHADGLKWLAESDIPVGAWYASAMFTGVKASKHPAVKAAGEGVVWLKRGDAIPLGDTGAMLRVLAPASLYEDKDDNNSLVMMLESGQGKMLLAGDMELPEEAELLAFGDDLKCDVLKVANHGDDDTTSAAFANACAAKLAVISTDSGEKPGTPDPGVVSRLEAAGSRVVVTQDYGLGLRIALEGGAVEVEDLAFGAPRAEGLYIAAVDAEDDRITVGNRSEKAIDLAGFYLCSEKGDELFVFPDGATIPAGGEMTVGTNSTDGDFDILWPDKKVVSKKKSDGIGLYDGLGRLIDRKGNGL